MTLVAALLCGVALWIAVQQLGRSIGPVVAPLTLERIVPEALATVLDEAETIDPERRREVRRAVFVAMAADHLGLPSLHALPRGWQTLSAKDLRHHANQAWTTIAGHDR